MARGNRLPAGAERSVREDDALATRAHVLRRATFGPFPGATEASLARYPSTADQIEALLAAPPLDFTTPASIDVPFAIDGKRVLGEEVLGNGELINFWLGRMASDDAGVHERMMWFWHTDFTTSGRMGTFLYLWRQLRTLHQHALGNLRDLALALTLDPAMMQFLDLARSFIEAPNENYARELMELFLLGRNNYTEADVRAAAVGLSGWTIDFTANGAVYTDTLPMPEVEFLGRRAVYNPEGVIDQILAQPGVAPFIVDKMWRYLIGGQPDPTLTGPWADAFRSSGYEIRPLVESILRSEAFSTARATRPRSGVEWLIPTLRALNPPGDLGEDLRYDELDALGQVPYFPPNVAGWPSESVWLSPAIAFSRASFVSHRPGKVPSVPASRRVDAALERCAVYDITDRSRRALDELNRTVSGSGAERMTTMVKAVLLTPEFAIA